MSEKSRKLPTKAELQGHLASTKKLLLEAAATDLFKNVARILVSAAGGYLVICAIAGSESFELATEDYRIYVGALLLILNLWLTNEDEAIVYHADEADPFEQMDE